MSAPYQFSLSDNCDKWGKLYQSSSIHGEGKSKETKTEQFKKNRKQNLQLQTTGLSIERIKEY